MRYFGHEFSFKGIFTREQPPKSAHSPICSGLVPAAFTPSKRPESHLTWQSSAEKSADRRTAYRVHTALTAQYIWDPAADATATAAVHNLSGGGLQLLANNVPKSSHIALSLHIPQAFVNAWMRHRATVSGPVHPPWEAQREKIQGLFKDINGRIVYTGPAAPQDSCLFRVSIAFDQPHEGCYRLVRYLERRTIQRVRQPHGRPVAVAA